MEEEKNNNDQSSVNSSDSAEQSLNKDYGKEASQFIQETSLEKMLEMAEIARIKKLSEPPKWVFPDEI